MSRLAALFPSLDPDAVAGVLAACGGDEEAARAQLEEH
eukprot:gene17742-57041_t